MNLTGNDLKSIGFPEGKAMGIALTLVNKEGVNQSKEEQLALLGEILKSPVDFENDERFGQLAKALMTPKESTVALNTNSMPYEIYGAGAIEQGALKQMEVAMKLPVTVAGALMPDAHQGYGLPIG